MKSTERRALTSAHLKLLFLVFKTVSDISNSLSDLRGTRGVIVSVRTGYALTLTLSLREREIARHPLSSMSVPSSQPSWEGRPDV